VTRFLEPIPSYFTKANISNFAEQLADDLELEIGASLEPLVEDLGGEIRYGHSSYDEVDGGSIYAFDYNDFEIVLSEYTSPSRDRFTIAHELGHLFLHLRLVKEKDNRAAMRATRWIDDTDDQQQRAEWEANWFAAAFLMPENSFLKTIHNHGLSYTAAKFNVSLAAANVRLKSLSK